MKKSVVCTMAAATIISATAAFGAVKEGSFAVTPLVGGYIFDGGKSLDPTLVLGIRGGYNFTKNIGIEALYDYATPTDGKSNRLKDISLHRFGGQALYHFFPDNVFVPYLAAGYSGVKYEGNGVNQKKHGAFDYGIGAKYFMTDDIAVRADVRHIYYRYNTWDNNDLEFTLGAYFQFGAATPPAKAVAAPTPLPEPVKVVAAPAPEPAIVAPAPVPVPVPVPVPPADTDHDGVIDTQDKCPGTPAGVAVDGSGCPIDSDKDGVADYLDKCPATPAGVAVDGSGCPIDSDKDGVADYLDKCPATPAGVAVDTSGCPVDSDKDGVADYLDKCPDTPAGVAVSANGCPQEAAKRFCDKPAVIEVSFDTNKADLKAKYHDELDKLGNFLKEFPGSKGTINGYTDADGSKNANLKLSQARAESVRNYIITKFAIEAGRITAKGYGPANPVASNKTAEGKAKNRRIEAVFSCE
ncbi:MAG: OmpA family protein [Desulfuromonadaceae bacterium]|nr:OmpA family protein [Desulfuromonadaceae bacterium]